jgi:hypothetical protein
VDPHTVSPSMVKRFGTLMIVVNLTVAFFSLTDMYLLASGAVRVEYPDEGAFETSFDPANMDLVFRSEYKITNNGFYDIDGLSIKADLYSQEGKLLINYRSEGLNVPRFCSRTFPIEARLPVERALAMNLRDLLFEGSTFVLKVRIDADYVMNLVHFHISQVMAYPWEPPTSQFKDLIANGSLVDMVLKLLGGQYGEVGKQVENALVDAFMEPGQEAKVSLNGWADLTATVEEQTLHVQVDLTYPIQATLFEFNLPLGDLLGDGDGP